MTRAPYSLSLLRRHNRALSRGHVDVALEARERIDHMEERNGFVRRPNCERVMRAGEAYGHQRRRRPCSLSRTELDARIRELHTVRNRLLNLSLERRLTLGEVHLAKHVLRELDWYEMHEAEPGFKAMDEERRKANDLVRRVKKLARSCGC